jgi:branched-subunit amino acid ABC-type transport system permease component
VLIGFSTNIFSWYIGDEWTLSFVFAVLALVMLVRPEGIVSGRAT